MQFTAGALGGTLLTPVPWKLADDGAIWSQNWSWRPSPSRGEVTQTPTICLFCDGGCGIQARLVDRKRAILLEGNPNHPVNAGGICPLGAAGLQFLYAPSRVSQPLRQTRSRGDLSGFQPVTWEEAFDEVAEKLVDLRSGTGPHALACITTHRRSSMDDLWSQFFQAYGSPNLFKMPSPPDHLRVAANFTTGIPESLAFALENADHVLSFDSDLLEGWGAPGRLQRIYGAWARESSPGARPALVHLGSRCSVTASKATQWLPVRHGSEPLVAMSMAHVMVREGLHDTSQVNANVFGFDDWEDSVGRKHTGFRSFVLSREFSPGEVAKKVGLEAGKIEELARGFAGAHHAVAVWGKGQGSLPTPLRDDLTYLTLNILKGNLKAGGMVSLVPSVPLGPLPPPALDSVAREGLAQARLDSGVQRLFPWSWGSATALVESLHGAPPYIPEVLLVHEANPLFTLPETPRVESSLNKVGWMVSLSSFMDETARMSDLILPNHMALERLEDVVGLPGAPYGYYGVAKPILPPEFHTRHTGDLLLQLARALGGTVADSMGWKSYEEYLQERVSGLFDSGLGRLAEVHDMDPAALKPSDSLSANFKDPKDLWKQLLEGKCWVSPPMDIPSTLETPSRRIELAVEVLQTRDVHEKRSASGSPRPVPPEIRGASDEFPLVLAPYSALQVSDGYYANPPFMTKTVFDFVLRKEDQFVDINPETARGLHLAEGDRALLKTPIGQALVRVHLHNGAQPGVVYILRGFGHTAHDEYIGGKGVNPNQQLAAHLDGVTGMGVEGFTAARLSKA